MPRKTMDPIIYGLPEEPGNPFESFGELIIQLDDAAYEDVAGKMHSMTNQAVAAKSTTWTANAGDYVLISDVQGSGRTAFSRFGVVSQFLVSDVLEDAFVNGVTFGVVCKFVDDPVHMLTSGTSPNGVGYLGVRSFNTYSTNLNAGSDTACSETNAAVANVWHVIVCAVNTSRTVLVVDAVDETRSPVDVWDGVNPASFFKFDHAMYAGSNSERADYLGVYAYDGGLDNENINNLGQKMADDFGFTQTWNFAG